MSAEMSDNYPAKIELDSSFEAIEDTIVGQEKISFL